MNYGAARRFTYVIRIIPHVVFYVFYHVKYYPGLCFFQMIMLPEVVMNPEETLNSATLRRLLAHLPRDKPRPATRHPTRRIPREELWRSVTLSFDLPGSFDHAKLKVLR